MNTATTEPTLAHEYISPFERALRDEQLSGEFPDVDVRAVVDALEHAPVGNVCERDLRALACAWLDAASRLRREQQPRTFATMATVVLSGAGFPASHAARMIVALEQAPANDDITQVRPRTGRR
jgi:hypothetical protein